MVSKDQTIGGAIFVICVVVGVLYTVGLFFWPGVNPLSWELRFWLIAIPVFLAFIAIMAIGAWIGWTMATTPPPKPIEEITSEVEEKVAEKPTEEAVTEAEEEKPERKRKSEK
jgi:predicted DNA-binding transcriptional regulator